MTELREAIAKAAFDGYWSTLPNRYPRFTWDQSEEHDTWFRAADQVLAVLRPHLGLGEAEEREQLPGNVEEAIYSLCGWIERQINEEGLADGFPATRSTMLERCQVLREHVDSFHRWMTPAIAGRGEGEGQ